MIRRIVLAITVPFVILMIFGCNAFHRSHASVEHVCSAKGENYYGLSLTKQTRELASGHSGLHFIVESYSLTLATKPEGQMTYPVTKITLRSAYSRTKNIAEFVSGQVVVDLNTRMVSVLLTTRDGKFPGNGEYPIRYIHMPVGCAECPE